MSSAWPNHVRPTLLSDPGQTRPGTACMHCMVPCRSGRLLSALRNLVQKGSKHLDPSKTTIASASAYNMKRSCGDLSCRAGDMRALDVTTHHVPNRWKNTPAPAFFDTGFFVYHSKSSSVRESSVWSTASSSLQLLRWRLQQNRVKLVFYAVQVVVICKGNSIRLFEKCLWRSSRKVPRARGGCMRSSCMAAVSE